MSHIFISYSRRDIDFAQQIVDALAANNLDTWIDWKSIPKGEDWEQEIYRGIEEADAFLFLISPDSVISEMCNKEIDHAVKNGKRLLPIFISNVENREIYSVTEKFLHTEQKEEINRRNFIICRQDKDDFDKAMDEVQTAIHTDYDWLKFHTRLQVKALDWERNNRDSSFLLSGKDLETAETELARNASKEPLPTDLQHEYTLRSRQVIDRRRRITTTITTIGMAIMVVLAIAATLFAVRAERETRIALSQALVANAQLHREDPSLSMLLALEGLKQVSNLPVHNQILPEQILRDSLSHIGGTPLFSNTEIVWFVTFSPDGQRLASVNADGSVRLWNVNPSSSSIELRDPGSPIKDVAFNPKGQWLATKNIDGIVHLWDLTKPVQNPVALPGQEGSSTSFAFSPDGQWLVTGHSDGQIRLWNVQDLSTEAVVFRGMEGSVTHLAFSRNNQWLAAGADGGSTIRIWDLNQPSAGPEILGGRSNTYVTDLSFSPNSRWLIAASYNNSIELWDMENLDADTTLWMQQGTWTDPVAFSPDNQWLAVGDETGKVSIWDLNNLHANPRIVPIPEGFTSAIAFSADSQWLAAGSSNSADLYMWNLGWNFSDSSVAPMIMQGHTSYIESIAFSSDGLWLATGGADGTARLWDMKNPFADPLILRGHDERISALAISPDSTWVATGSPDQTVRLWNTSNPFSGTIVLHGFQGLIYNVAFSPDGRWLAAGSTDGSTRLWDMQHLPASPATLPGTSLAFSADGEWLATGSDKGATRLWNMGSLSTNPIVLQGYKGNVFVVVFSPNGQWLATGGADGGIRLWNIQDLSADPIVLKGQAGSIVTLAFSPDSQWLAGGTENGPIELWKMKVLAADPISVPGRSVAFSPNGKWLATGSDNGTTRLWDVNNLSQAHAVFQGHEGAIFTLAFSPDGEWLATGNQAADRTTNAVRLWNLTDLTSNSIVFPNYDWTVYQLVFSPNGKWLAAGSDVAARLWQMDRNDLFNTTCRVIGRNFTRAEWTVYIGDASPYQAVCPDFPTEPEGTITPTP